MFRQRKTDGGWETLDTEQKMRQIYDQISEIAGEFGVEKIVLFGSRARKAHHPKSDIDIAVYGCKHFFEFRDRVEEEVWTLLRFDMIDMSQNYISRELEEEIKKDGVIIYEKI